MTRPSQPRRATTRFEPPPRIRTRSRSLACERFVELADRRRRATKRRAGPPTPSVVSGASGTSWSSDVRRSARDGRARLRRRGRGSSSSPGRAASRAARSPRCTTSWMLPAPSVITRSPGFACSSSHAREVLAARHVRDVLVAGLARELDERLARDAVDRLLAGGEDVADHDLVGVVERARRTRPTDRACA